MYNEKEVYHLSIGAACALSWPSDRIIVQVLDDSTDLAIKDMVEVECMKWASKGINIKYEIRDNRNGYKAGDLKQGLKHSYVSQYDFVAIFDADFQPEPDFLMPTIPFFVHNPEIGLVQARWKSDECLMTRMQEMSLNYHFIVEQEVGSQTYAFFGFNGSTTRGLLGLAPQSNFPNLINQTMPNIPNYAGSISGAFPGLLGMIPGIVFGASGGAVLPGIGATLGEVCREYLN